MGDPVVGAAVVGAAGTATLGEALRAEIPEEFTRAFGVRTTALAADAVTAYTGALGARAGAVVAAGTGLIALGTDLTGWQRADGWGHLLGDCGSHGDRAHRAGQDERRHDDRLAAAGISDDPADHACVVAQRAIGIHDRAEHRLAPDLVHAAENDRRHVQAVGCDDAPVCGLGHRFIAQGEDRQAALEKYVQLYADRVAQYVRLAPWNWFNFYDFWGEAKEKR